ncbi:MAG TPA: hypothetical protein VJ810_32825 [Blastocatellia bacterium]|nr:hypothetical protein [Blastocatellia bacterium]
MRTITLFSPEVKRREVTFRWQVEPSTTLYRRPHFTMRFPESVDLSRVPEGLWWRVMLICLHSQWPLLRSCRVRLPVRLQPGEAECWNRLMDVEVATLEAIRGTNDFERKIEIIEDGPPIKSVAPSTGATAARKCATAFSGGKDSLVQTGLLTELTEKPALIATTSPMPPLEDHITPRRRHILNEIQRRRDVTLIEVESDYRANFDHGFAQEQGYLISVNELTDTFLYAASLVAAGVAAGATHLFLASETQVQENVERDGRVIQHSHFMYSAITQGALDAILRPFGVSHGSLISSLHSFQVQELLWTRYGDISDLQYSCWRTRVGEMMCNNCSQCLRIALCALALGKQASQIGADWATLLNEMRDWRPKVINKPLEEAMPAEIVSQQLHLQVIRDLQAVSWRDITQALVSDRPGALLRPRGWKAISAFRKLRRDAMARDAGPRPGYRTGYLRLANPLLKDRVAKIYGEHFNPDDESSYAGVLARSEAMIKWITEPLSC